MHHHNVYFWLKPDLTDTDVSQFAAGLDSLLAIPSVKNGHYGKPVKSDRNVVEDSFSFSLHLNFDSSSDENLYQIHPDHQHFVTENESKWHKVMVFDSFC